jgi:hypothetical protein
MKPNVLQFSTGGCFYHRTIFEELHFNYTKNYYNMQKWASIEVLITKTNKLLAAKEQLKEKDIKT